MSGSVGSRGGGVYLAHAWVPVEFVSRTVGPWQWWNVYKDSNTAAMQALKQSRYSGWKGHGEWEVRFISA